MVIFTSYCYDIVFFTMKVFNLAGEDGARHEATNVGRYQASASAGLVD